ncbi:hypothetical protein DSM3645_03708 [Blastopirellula marina DSM 3645]|uniref:Uncharacterized protein n=1 Tax=Blastopirellula marina DSM 3645 TaxID=314230 RepID=A3ZW53_9BACT|nr:hypothetical protein DSM3645_03708 [Blastopirellula marina DSM 3645]
MLRPPAALVSRMRSTASSRISPHSLCMTCSSS